MKGQYWLPDPSIEAPIWTAGMVTLLAPSPVLDEVVTQAVNTISGRLDLEPLSMNFT